MRLKKFRVYFKAQIEVEASSKQYARNVVNHVLNILAPKFLSLKKLEITQVRKL